jgi:hypothetical protein
VVRTGLRPAVTRTAPGEGGRRGMVGCKGYGRGRSEGSAGVRRPQGWAAITGYVLSEEIDKPGFRALTWTEAPPTP